jgi:hypothetical protein
MESAPTALLGADDSCECLADENAGLVVGRVSEGGRRAMRIIANAFLFDYDERHRLALGGGGRSKRAIGLCGATQGSRG